MPTLGLAIGRVLDLEPVLAILTIHSGLALGDNPVSESNAAPSVLLLTHFDALYIRPVRKRRPQGYNPA